MLQLGPSPSPSPKLSGKRLSTPRGERSSADNSLQRLLTLQENIRHRARMNELQQRMQERRERRARIALRRAQLSSESGESGAAETPKNPQPPAKKAPRASSSNQGEGPAVPRQTPSLPPLGPLIGPKSGNRRLAPAPPVGGQRRRSSFRNDCALSGQRSSMISPTAASSRLAVRRCLDGDLSTFAAEPGFNEPDMEYGYDHADFSALEPRPPPGEPGGSSRKSPHGFSTVRDSLAGSRRVSLPAVKPRSQTRVNISPVEVCPRIPGNPRSGREASKPRCWQCSRKLRITATYSCRCGGSYCGRCRHAEQHSCKFDYKTDGRRILAENTPSALPSKLPKI